MRRYYLSKLGQALATISLVVLVVFALLRFMPTSGYFSKEEYREMDEVAKKAYLRSIGVLDPTLVQLKNFLARLFQGDLGRSMTLYPKSRIQDILSDKIKYSVMFNAFSWIVSAVIGLPLGVAMAKNKGGARGQRGDGVCGCRQVYSVHHHPLLCPGLLVEVAGVADALQNE